jgi:hypothetical protein
MARRWWTLVAVSLAAFMTYLDNAALPARNRIAGPALPLDLQVQQQHRAGDACSSPAG